MKKNHVYTLTLAATLLAVTGSVAADQKLAQQKSCLSCHQIDRKVIGPAYKDVANRYKGDDGAEARLAEKIQKGGKGNWGTIPMPPNGSVSPEEAATLAKWVLSL